MAQVVLQCDVAVVRVTNLDVLDLPPGSSHLFVRYYVAIGGGKRIRVDTRKLPCTAGDAEEARWDERASLECRPGSSTTANPLKELVLAAGGRSSSTVVFELRCRRSATTVWGKAAAAAAGGSRLLGRGEVAWSDAVDSPGMSVETWVRLATTKKKNQKLPAAAALLVRMGVRVEVSETVSASTEKIRRRLGRQQWWEDDECRCGSCGWVGSEEDMFLSATTAASMRP